jgi:SAM-dependent methyltransferase
MSLKAMYDKIAANYETADQFGAISLSHDAAISQIIRNNVGTKGPYKVLDLGVGNGLFLSKLNNYMPHADFTGIDISPEMLMRAAQKIPMTTIETSATEASRYLPAHSQDLILAHFINAYIPIHALFSQAGFLSKSTGYYSLITTTYESFPLAQQKLAEFISTNNLLASVVGHYYKAMVKNTTVANNLQDLLQAFHEHHFEVIEHKRLEIPIHFNHFEEMAGFGIEGTWFLNNLSVKMLPKTFLLNRLKRLFRRIFTFPFHDTHIIDVILAKK